MLNLAIRHAGPFAWRGLLFRVRSKNSTSLFQQRLLPNTWQGWGQIALDILRRHARDERVDLVCLGLPFKRHRTATSSSADGHSYLSAGRQMALA